MEPGICKLVKVVNMNILVSCFSLSGNTQKIAQAILETCSSEGHKVAEKALSEITSDSFKKYDLVFLGSACHDGDLAEPVRLILDEIDDNVSFKLAGFVTHATTMPEGSDRNRELFARWAGKCEETLNKVSDQKEFDLLDYFHCQGIPTPLIEDFIHREIISDESEWDEYITEVRQHPNHDDLMNVKAFAKEVLLKANQS